MLPQRRTSRLFRGIAGPPFDELSTSGQCRVAGSVEGVVHTGGSATVRHMRVPAPGTL